MEEVTIKINHLTDTLAQQATNVSKKKEEVEALSKSVISLEKELNDLRVKVAMASQEKFLKTGAITSAKEEIRKRIEAASRIVNADKAALQAEKAELQPKIDKLQAEITTKQNEKSQLLQTKKTEQGNLPPPKEEKKQDEPEETLESLTKSLKIEKDNAGFLSVASLTAIMEACTTLAATKFKDTVYEKRKKLRAKGGADIKTFLEHSGNEVSENTKFLEQLMQQVLEKVNLDKSIVDKSIEYYITNGNFEVMALMDLFGEKFKSFLKGTKPIDKDTFRDILKFKVEYIEKNAPAMFSEDNRRQIVQSHLASEPGSFAQKEQIALNLLKNYLEFKVSNAIFEKFGVEDEDIRDAATNPDIQYDMDIASLMLQNEETMYKAVPQLAQGPTGIGHAQNY